MLTMMMSIMHRITGVGLYFGIILLVWWLTAASISDCYFDFVQGFFGHWFGRLVLFRLYLGADAPCAGRAAASAVGYGARL